MRFYITRAGEPTSDGIDLPDAETVLIQTAEAALGIARDQLGSSPTSHISLEVSSDDGPVGTVTVDVVIDRT